MKKKPDKISELDRVVLDGSDKEASIRLRKLLDELEKEKAEQEERFKNYEIEKQS